MHKNLKAWARACIACQRNEFQRHNKAPIGTFLIPDERFRSVHLDTVDPCLYPMAIPISSSTWIDSPGLHSHQHYSLSSVRQWDVRAVSQSVEGLPTRRRRSGELDRPSPPGLAGQDLDCPAAALVFGATVRLPGQMISPTPRVAVEDPTNLLHRLRQFVRTLSPVPPGPHVSEIYIEKDLATCPHVYLQCGRVRRPLKPPYDGPFRVISRGTKNLRMQRGPREEVVSVERLKAAVPDAPPDEPCDPLPPAPPPP
nr:unnamed protein product [Spirometra erinaceieuropaei]